MLWRAHKVRTRFRCGCDWLRSSAIQRLTEKQGESAWHSLNTCLNDAFESPHHRRAGHGDLATRLTRCSAASFGQGSQYTSEQVQRLMADNGATCSMSRSGNVWDNAAMESFLLAEVRTDRAQSLPHAQRDKAGCVRLHRVLLQSHARTLDLGYLTPMDLEKQANIV